MTALITILCSTVVSFFTAALVGYSGIPHTVPNLFLLVFGWVVNSAVAIIIYNALQ